MVLWTIVFAVNAHFAQAAYRKGTDIDPDKKIRAEAVSHKWPPKSPPLFLFFEKHGHFKYMNSISQNSGYKNIRDGMYHQTYIYTWGNAKSRPFSTLDEGLTMRPYSSYGRAEGADPYGIFCPPRKLPNMRGHVVFISSETSGNVFPNDHMLKRDIPFELRATRGTWRPGKNVKKVPFKMQEAVFGLEVLPNFFHSISLLIGAFPFTVGIFFKTLATGGWGTAFGFYNFDFKLEGTTTTIMMALVWMNETNAAKQMKTAPPILDLFKKRIIILCTVMGFLAAINCRTLPGEYGEYAWQPSTYNIIFVVMPLIGFGCAVFFQNQAGKVTEMLSDSSENAAMIAFRNKMILNLARAGFFDIGSLPVLLVMGSIPATAARAPDFNIVTFLAIVFFRDGVSHFQLIAIEPAAARKARDNKRKKLNLDDFLRILGVLISGFIIIVFPRDRDIINFFVKFVCFSRISGKLV
ncbi:hypothetical protein AURANDRAFT_67504 [Aureococcus anophagefferens]|uniref:Uncharacterized protein n=1 Tax=Aureococcus anophagefferens TaxID=44056 RepID=F0YLD7_AURAN|nr:hypothetical protein AURANDRAFT_67504 [Aureococcus anophagefferens]EGB04102.1 hypothetical protein AURANDRAFT_67504 [Aureococcus anophagefferens]|eukprot:XP_009041227.1 hypothetical protein AURANDRAFT_67504 [Aureococcus anophagefferens]